MEVLVDTSVWIDYFRSGDNTQRIDYLIDENLVVINDLILAELLPFLMVRSENKVVTLLKGIKKNAVHPDWDEVIENQVRCLKSGTSGVGIPDLLIAQNGLQNNTPIYTLDKHFQRMRDAGIGIEIYG